MRPNTLFIIIAAVIAGLAAALMVRSLLRGSADVAGKKIVVAAHRLQFGDSIEPQDLQEIGWPSSQTPEGSYSSINEVVKEGQPPRFALTNIPPLSPVVASQITAAGQKASMASLIEEGKSAVTVRVDDVRGVAGFVMPGDKVDVALTRTDSTSHEAFVDIILRNVKVLAIDQRTKERQESAQVAKSVTLEVTSIEGEKLILATGVGSLSLILRNSEDDSFRAVRRVTSEDLIGETTNNEVSPKNSRSVDQSTKIQSDERGTQNSANIRVIRKGSVQESSVFAE